MNTKRIRHRFVSRPVLLLFGVFFVTSFLPGVFALPAYLVQIFLYDSIFGLENVAYLLAEVLPISRLFLWEVGRVLTYYLAAVGIVWFVDQLQFRLRRDKPVQA